MGKYSIIPLQKRMEFIYSVVIQQKGLTKMARKYRIKLSTAKSMMRVYRKTGKILDKKPRIQKQKQKISGSRQSQQEVMVKTIQKDAKQGQEKKSNEQQQHCSQRFITGNQLNNDNYLQSLSQIGPKYYPISEPFNLNYQYFFWSPYSFN